MDPHHLAEVRSLALHRAIADRLCDDPAVLLRARERVRDWARSGSVHPEYVRAWQELLETDAVAVAAAIVVDDERMRALRQVTPFAGVVPPRERWSIWRRVRADAERRP